MKSILFILLLCPSLMVMGQNRKQKKAMDAKDGFRNIKLESSISSFKNLMTVETDNNHRFCRIRNEDLAMGEATLDSVIYCFYKDKLESIMLFATGYSNSRVILNILQSAYGHGSKDNPYIETYFWDSNLVSIVYKENSINHNSVTAIFSEPLKLEDNNNQKTDAENAARNSF